MTFSTIIQLLKWLSQGLLLVVGVWSLLSNPYQTDAKTGRRRLTRNGWMKVALLGLGFVLFAFTELDQRRSARLASDQQAKTIQRQEESLAYLRRVLLQQHQVSGLQMALTFPEAVAKRFGDSIEEFGKGTRRQGNQPDQTKLAYIRTACSSGNAFMRFGPEGRGQLDYSIYRPQGLVVARVTETEPEWQALVSAFRALLGDRLEMVSDAGRVLVDVFNPERPFKVQFLNSAVTIDLRSPGIHLDELQGAVSFLCGDAKLVFTESKEGRVAQPMEFGPSKIRLTSKDPRVDWNQEIPVIWVPHTTRKIYEVELDQTAELGEWRSGPHRVHATFQGLNLP